jgi:hypothetical protein
VARRHLGLETQRQWSDPALRRTTPALLGLFSRVTLGAHWRLGEPAGPVRQAAWDQTPDPTVADALALVRRQRWAQVACCTSASQPDTGNVPRRFVDRLTDTLCSAAGTAKVELSA